MTSSEQPEKEVLSGRSKVFKLDQVWRPIDGKVGRPIDGKGIEIKILFSPIDDAEGQRVQISTVFVQLKNFLQHQ